MKKDYRIYRRENPSLGLTDNCIQELQEDFRIYTESYDCWRIKLTNEELVFFKFKYSPRYILAYDGKVV